jgi:hypothetical protein
VESYAKAIDQKIQEGISMKQYLTIPESVAIDALPLNLRLPKQCKGGGRPPKTKQAAKVYGPGPGEAPLTPDEEEEKEKHESLRKSSKGEFIKAKYTLDQLKILTGSISTWRYCMQAMKLVANEYPCDFCGMTCTLTQGNAGGDGKSTYWWTCSCKLGPERHPFKRALLHNSFFSNKSTPYKFIDFLFFYLRGTTKMNELADILDVGSYSVKGWKQDARARFRAVRWHVRGRFGGTENWVRDNLSL